MGPSQQVLGNDLHIGGPQGEIVAEELHDQSAVLVRLLPQSIQLRNRFIERLRGRPPTLAKEQRPFNFIS